VVQCSTCAFKAPRGAPFLAYCAAESGAAARDTLQWGQIGPLLLDRAVRKFGLASYCLPVHAFNPIHYYEFQAITAGGFDMSRLARSHAVHLWNQMWQANGIDPSHAANDGSLYRVLSNRFL